MKRQIPPDLMSSFAVSFGLAVVLFLLQCALAVALAAQALVAMFLNKGGDGQALLLWIIGAMVVNGYALSRAIKSRHLLGLFSEWPGLPEEASPESETRLLALSARHAYLLGDYPKALNLFKRLGWNSTHVELARGRALVMQGEFEEALLPLKNGGQGAAAQRYLSIRRRWWFWERRYFQPGDVDWAHRSGRLALLGLLTLLLTLPVLTLTYQNFWQVLAAQRKAWNFSDKDFEVAEQGRFKLYYHDEAFMRQTADLAEEALSKDLEFLGLPADSFAPGQIQLYLCADQKEYLARAPFARPWEGGSASPEKSQIYLYHYGERQRVYYEVTVAHELGHLCYHKFVPHGTQDSWLNEGLANYLGYKFALERLHYPRQDWLMAHYFNNLKQHSLSFDQFWDEDPRHLETKDVSTFYTQGSSIVYVLIEDYGREPFLKFLRALGAGKPLAESLSWAYPTIRNATELQAVWALFMR